MKSVLISIQPKWVEKIASGKKTIDVRKTRPKLDTPFKCYIYCTNGTQLVDVRKERIYLDINKPFLFTNGKSNNVICSTPPQVNRKVIGEFVCDRIDDLRYVPTKYYLQPAGTWEEMICNNSCLSVDEIKKYAKGKAVYGWHISNLKIYDKPKELSEFYIYDGEKRRPSIDCEHKKPGYSHDWCLQMDGRFCNQCLCDKKRLTRPPQSWCYVESGVQL